MTADPRTPVTLLVTLLLITLLAALPGCAAFPGKPATSGADVGLLQPCVQPAGSAETNGAIAAWLLDTQRALRACNDQITTFKESSNGKQ